ncbi:MAG: ACP phosphodiesterase [Salinivirgaceae bacterium]
MNILAHLYLSKGINKLMLGNYMGDFVKGNQYLNYPEPIQQGILLHRKIDDFTDKHEAHRSSRDRFRKKYGLHSGIVVDIVYDHFLANRWNFIHPTPLEDYASEVYLYISQNQQWLPQRLNEITTHLIKNNWLVLYKSLSGIEKVLKGMAYRTSLPDQVSFAMEIIDNEYTMLQQEFQELIELLDKLAQQEINGKLLELNYNEIINYRNI